MIQEIFMTGLKTGFIIGVFIIEFIFFTFCSYFAIKKIKTYKNFLIKIKKIQEYEEYITKQGEQRDRITNRIIIRNSNRNNIRKKN